MAISYSGLVNYGKATLPSVESWGTNMNIFRDPPKSVQTRKIDKVGETSAITSMVDDSGDRFCEAINYYARGQNPMVSVSYGQGQRKSCGNGGEAFLPYRVVREGAFRPPIWRQEDLLPLSRLPRVWTQVNTQPYQPIFTKRIRNCGTAEDMREVKNDTLKMACVASKTIAAYPNSNRPDVKPGLLRDPLNPGEIRAAASCNMGDVEIKQRSEYGPLLLAPTRPGIECSSNKTAVGLEPDVKDRDVTDSGIVRKNILQGNLNVQKSSCGMNSSEIEQRMKYKPIFLRSNKPLASGRTNVVAIKETPIVLNNVVLKNNHPSATAYTNFAAPSLSGYNPQSLSKEADKCYSRLPPRTPRGGFDGNVGMPMLMNENSLKTLVKVR